MIKQYGVLGVVIICLLNACSAAPGDATTGLAEGDLAQAKEEVIGGSVYTPNYWNVGVYIRVKGTNGTVNWWGMGSGEIIGTIENSAGAIAYYLVGTARHNTEGSSAPWDPSQLAVTTALSPGSPASLGGNLCPTCVKPAWIYNTSGPDSIILLVPAGTFTSGLTSTAMSGRLSLSVGDNSNQHNRTGYVFGYGTANTAGGGVGTLRRAGGQRVVEESLVGDSIRIASDDSSIIIGAGDSGGPLARNFTYADAAGVNHSWQLLLGISYETFSNNTYAIDAGPQLAAALQAVKGYLYVSSPYNPAGHLQRTSDSVGTVVHAESTSNDWRARWRYDYTSKTLSAASLNLCLTGYSGEGSYVLGEACSGSNNQKWVHNKHLQLVNSATGKCANYTSNGAVRTATCNTAGAAEQAWVFHGYDR